MAYQWNQEINSWKSIKIHLSTSDARLKKAAGNLDAKINNRTRLDDVSACMCTLMLTAGALSIFPQAMDANGIIS